MNEEYNHSIDHTNKVVIILGLIIETLSTIVFTAVAVGVATFDNWFNYSTTMEMPYDDYEQLVYVFNILGTVFIILAIIMIGILILNHILFRKLIKGYLTEKQARNVYLYLAIYGGLYLFSNQILGILYLISGIRGYKGEKEETDIRDGI